MFDPILDWFHQQTSRDQQVLKIGAVAVIIAIVYFAFLGPFIEGRSTLQDKVATAEKELLYLKQSAASFTNNTGPSAASSRLSASQIATSSARKFSVSLARVAPKRNNQTSLTIDQVKFNNLLSWLDDIQKQGLIVDTIDINKVENVGFVKATITVSGGVG